MQILIGAVLLAVIILLLLVIFGFFFFLMDLFLELPYVATKKGKIDTIISLAQIKEEERVVDLGSGDGRLLFATAQKGAHAIGYEINPFLIWLTRIKARFFLHPRGVFKATTRLHPGGVTVKRQSLWQSQKDLKKADVIFVYAYRKSMQKFEDFVFQNAKKGTRIVVNTNPFPTKKPIKSENGIFLYKVLEKS